MKLAVTGLTVCLLGALAWSEPTPQILCHCGAEPLTGFSTSGERAYIDWGEGVTVFDLKKWRTLARFPGMKRVLGTSLNRDGSLLAVGDYPSKLMVFDCDKGRLRWSFSGAQTDGAYDVSFSPRENLLLCWGGSHGRSPFDPKVSLFNGDSGRKVCSWDWGTSYGQELAWAEDGACFVRGAKDKLQSYSSQGRKISEVRLGGESIHVDTHPLGVKVRHYADRGAHCVESVHATPSLKVLSLQPDLESDTLENPDHSLSWKRDGDKLVVTDKQGQAVYTSAGKASLSCWTRNGFVLLDAEGAHCLSTTGQPLGDAPAYLYKAAGSDFAMEGVGYGGPCRIFDLGTGKMLGKLAFAAGPSYSADGRRAAVCTQTGLLILDIPASLKEQRLVPSR